MPESRHDRQSAESIVREALAAGDRLRRSRDAMRRFWRAAPVAAAGCLGLAAVTRWTTVPAAVPIAIVVSGVSALLAFAIVSRRQRPLSDAAATTLDRDADMRGELRSANWFAARESRDSWADFHLVKAAERVQRVNWTELYPRTRARRAQAATLVLLGGALIVIFTIPERVNIGPMASAHESAQSTARSEGPGVGRILDPELQRQLEELLAAASDGHLPTAEAMAASAEMREILNRLAQLSDAELLEALKRALAANPDARAASAAESFKKLAEQARAGAENGTLPRELQDALEKLSDEMEIAKSDGLTTAEDASAEASSGPQGQMDEAAGAGAGQELSIQFAKAAEAGGGAGVMMMSSPDNSQSGAGGAGIGGSGSDEAAQAAAAIDAALKKETVEASQDNPGENVQKDIRRKTEHGTATVGFTGSAVGTFDRTRAAAAPPVPEARRTGVQSYFVRTAK